jgi:hypothetical protein
MARPQLAKADNAFPDASVGQPTEPCLAEIFTNFRCFAKGVYKFPPAPRFDASRSGPQLPADESEPDKVLEEIYGTELVKRLPRAQ